jgi:structural maintenance of chromosome 1
VTSHSDYNSFLESENILVKARNFLVFQGDIESVANKSPKELTRLIEQICGSEEVREEYERLKEEHDRAVESSTFAFNRRRGLTAEIRAVQEQKEDVVRFEQLMEERSDLLAEMMLWRLFRVEQEATAQAKQMDAVQGTLDRAQGDVAAHDQAFKDARKEQARVQKDLAAIDRQLKKARLEADRADPQRIAAQAAVMAAQGRVKDLHRQHDQDTAALLRSRTEAAQMKGPS